jgi:MFS family permease
MTDDPQDTEPNGPEAEPKKSPLQEITQPFIDLIHAPRALWGINLAYVIEGMCYFGVLNYLTLHFSDFIFRGVEHADVYSHNMVAVLTAGITIAMFFLGFIADKWGVRLALILAFCLMTFGRAVISAAPTVLGLQPAGLWSALHIATMVGIGFIVVGYGMYQPAAYTAVRKFTNPKTAAMGFAMLYALMNLGGWLPTFAFLLRDQNFLNLGITGVYWVYTGFTSLALVATILILTPRTVKEAAARAKAETDRIKAEDRAAKATDESPDNPMDKAEAGADSRTEGNAPFWRAPGGVPLHLWAVWVLLFVAASRLDWTPGGIPLKEIVWGILALTPIVIATLLPGTWRKAAIGWFQTHPLADLKFFFFIFALIPVQTLFTYNWFVLPQYVYRTFQDSWIGEYFEIAVNANPLLIFIFVPIITALTQKARVYNMMIIGTFVMAAPTFLNVIGAYWWTLFGYIVIMTIGEAMWQPRFLQYAAQIAPEGRTGVYMGVAQLPWFLTKVLVPVIYSGRMIDRFCPAEGEKNTQFMWLVFGCIAMCSSVLLVLAKRWVGKDFKEKA